MSHWEKTALAGSVISGFGEQSSRFLNRTLADFEAAVVQRRLSETEDGCSRQRAEINQLLRQQLHSIFLVQRSNIEQLLYQRLKKDLLREMQRKSRELNVMEKLRLLKGSMRDYDARVRGLLPFFVENAERDRAESRLSRLQWGIHEAPEAQDMLQRWRMNSLRRSGTMHRPRKLSVSLSPGLRLLFRPAGFGNFQVHSQRKVGPQHNLNEVSVGILNDGSVMDVYNQASKPPLLTFQPSIGVDVKTG